MNNNKCTSMTNNLLQSRFHKTCSTPEEAALLNLTITENNLTCEESEHQDDSGIRKARFHFGEDTFAQYPNLEEAMLGRIQTDDRLSAQLKGHQENRYNWVGTKHRRARPSFRSL